MLSDLYALGVTECDNMLMLLGVSQKFSEKERDVVVPMMINGFKDCAEEGGVMVTGGQTVINPWMTIGGVATTVCQPNEFIMYVLLHLPPICSFKDSVSLITDCYCPGRTVQSWVMFSC